MSFYSKRPPSEELKLFQRCLEVALIEVHPIDDALVVKYELDSAFGDNFTAVVLKEANSLIKLIRIKDLNSETDIEVVATEIIDKCKYLTIAMQPQLEQSLHYLKKRQKSVPPSIPTKKENAQDIAFGPKGLEILKAFAQKHQELAHMNKLDDYIENLYEGDQDKIKACSLVLQLVRKRKNLAVLSNKDPLIGAIARVLREDGKKSLELSTHIVYIFFCFSSFRQFHYMIGQHKVGSCCMELVDSELKRHDLWTVDLERRRATAEQDKSSPSTIVEYEKRFQKFIAFSKKQNQLLRICFYLLYNIGEDVKVELKMANRGIVSFLSKALKRNDPELICLCLMFLKRLSIYGENRNDMLQSNVIENMVHLVPNPDIDVQGMSLCLLWNLSFDMELRNTVVRCTFVPKIVAVITNERCTAVALSILYHVSTEDRYKVLFTYSDCIPIVLDLILKSSAKTPLPLIAFAINLATNKRNGQLMCSKNKLESLMTRALSNKDCMMMKMIRNISLHDSLKEKFLKYVDPLFQAVINGFKSGYDFKIECMGILGNLTIAQVSFYPQFKAYGFVAYAEQCFLDREVKQDILLEIINISSAAASRKECAHLIFHSDMVKGLIDTLEANQEDDEIVLQIMLLFYKLTFHFHTQKKFYKSKIPAYVLDLMNDRNQEIKKMCNRSLDIICADDTEWALRVKMQKFRCHNAQWLDMTQSHQIDDNDFYADDSYTPCIQESDLLMGEDLLFARDAYESMLSEGSLSPNPYDSNDD